MPPTHRVKFEPSVVKAAIVQAIKVYNLLDGVEHVYRIIKKEEIIPPHAKLERLKDGREVVRIIDMEGKETALEKMIQDDIDRQGTLYHFVAGWSAHEGLLEPMPEEASQPGGNPNVPL